MTSRLSPGERREQILDAVVPAILEHGIGVTSRQLAQAAGVAEGTLFRSFGDKESLLRAVLERETFERLTTPVPAEAPAASLEALIDSTARELVGRFSRLFALTMALGPLATKPGPEVQQRFDSMYAQLAETFEPFAADLRVRPDAAAEIVASLAFTAASTWGRVDHRATLDEILDVLRGGLVATPTRPRPG